MKFNSPFMDFMNTTAQFIALNFCFLICCIPIITIGPAIAAMYQVLLRESRGEHGYLIKKYWQHFLKMFWQGLFTFIFFAVIIAFMVFGAAFWLHMNDHLSLVVTIVIAIVASVVLSGMMYSFPLMARFDNTFRQTIKNAFCIALTNMKTTFILLALHITVAGLFYLFQGFKVFMLLIGFAFFTYVFSFIFTKLFRKYEPAEEEAAENDAHGATLSQATANADSALNIPDFQMPAELAAKAIQSANR